MLLKLVAGVVSALGLAGFVAVLGGAVVWVRLHSVDLPADQAVAFIPNSQLVVTGAAPLVFFLVLGALAVVGVYVAEPSGVASTWSASAIVVLVGVELGYAVVSGGFRSEARSRSSGSSRSTRSRRSGCSGAGEGGAGTARSLWAQARRPPPRSSRSTERRGSSSATSRSSSGFPGQASRAGHRSGAEPRRRDVGPQADALPADRSGHWPLGATAAGRSADAPTLLTASRRAPPAPLSLAVSR